MHVMEEVSQRLGRFVADQRDVAASTGPIARQLFDAAAMTLTGGKRLRAQFCHTGWVAAGGEPYAEEAIAVASSLEIFQAAALVHDDLIDHSDTRRGRPAAHRALEIAHRDAGWSGSSEDFGVSGAILLGDLLVAWSDDLLEEAVAGHLHAPLVRAEYGRMRRDVTLGQFLDVAQESAWVTQPEAEHADRALEIASLKSARYSVEQPLIIGAALAGATEDQRSSLREFGHHIGIAFQLRDDVLGVFGDTAETGKPAGDDIREGKRTILVAYTRERLSPDAKDRFDEALGDRDLSTDEVHHIQQEMQTSGALDRVESIIEENATAALGVLATAPLQEGAREDLARLAEAAIHRRA
ncbi:polyprenyl synthetase family protein [Microbacterium mitrae]|uniref:Polyprenyl synthetase family protein n=2 Tax=Microbacterium mitrae TaxID=664640 RepID=A0A5C8HN65_9MICO|nr:polyprenyl synthetase family protein [Microbacterium mitrae]